MGWVRCERASLSPLVPLLFLLAGSQVVHAQDLRLSSQPLVLSTEGSPDVGFSQVEEPPASRSIMAALPMKRSALMPLESHVAPTPHSASVSATPLAASVAARADGSDTVPPCMTLGGRDIGCLSAQNWIPADLLRQRARMLIQLYCEEDECQRRAAQALANFLCMQAKHQEDIGAASALKAYYTRIALREQIALTLQSMELIDTEDSKQAAAQQGGLPAGTDLSAFERSRISVVDQQLQIESKDRQLRSLLAQLTGVNYEMSQVCQEQLEVIERELNCENLKALALAQRQDLRSWIYLQCHVNEESAPIFARMLGTLIGGYGLPVPTITALKALICPPDYSRLAANMRYEIQLTVETHRKWICQAIEEKCAALQLAYARIILAQQTIDSWRARIQQLEALMATGQSVPEEIAEARTELLRARAEEIARRLDAKIAEVDLAEASGGISNRCCAGQAWLQTGFE